MRGEGGLKNLKSQYFTNVLMQNETFHHFFDHSEFFPIWLATVDMCHTEIPRKNISKNYTLFLCSLNLNGVFRPPSIAIQSWRDKTNRTPCRTLQGLFSQTIQNFLRISSVYKHSTFPKLTISSIILQLIVHKKTWKMTFWR